MHDDDRPSPTLPRSTESLHDLLIALVSRDSMGAVLAARRLERALRRGDVLPPYAIVTDHVDRRRAYDAAVDALAAQLPQAEEPQS